MTEPERLRSFPTARRQSALASGAPSRRVSGDAAGWTGRPTNCMAHSRTGPFAESTDDPCMALRAHRATPPAGGGGEGRRGAPPAEYRVRAGPVALVALVLHVIHVRGSGSRHTKRAPSCGSRADTSPSRPHRRDRRVRWSSPSASWHSEVRRVRTAATSGWPTPFRPRNGHHWPSGSSRSRSADPAATPAETSSSAAACPVSAPNGSGGLSASPTPPTTTCTSLRPI